MILEPGQDPVRQPFMEPKQFISDNVPDKDYFQNVTEGTVFPDEELVFGLKSLKPSKTSKIP
jgi:hypothetical protein